MPKSFIILLSVLRESSRLLNVYINPELNIINPSSDVLDLGVYMSKNCTFDFYVSCAYCCIFGFPKYTHSVCWWRLAISAGGPLICMSVSV